MNKRNRKKEQFFGITLKFVLIICIFVTTSGLIFGAIPSVTINTPNGGEIWKQHDRRTITWSYSLLPDTTKIKLLLTKNRIILGTIAEDIRIDKNTYLWRTGHYIRISGSMKVSTAAAGTGYKVTIQTMDMDRRYSDSSNGSFTISELRVIKPNGGERWLMGQTKEITWSAVGVGSQIDIELLKDDTRVGTIKRVFASAGRTTWEVGKLRGRSSGFGPGYKIALRSIGRSKKGYYDKSDNAFTIFPKIEPIVAVLYRPVDIYIRSQAWWSGFEKERISSDPPKYRLTQEYSEMDTHEFNIHIAFGVGLENKSNREQRGIFCITPHYDSRYFSHRFYHAGETFVVSAKGTKSVGDLRIMMKKGIPCGSHTVTFDCYFIREGKRCRAADAVLLSKKKTLTIVFVRPDSLCR